MSDLHEHSKIEIENRLVAERAKLSGALEELRGRLSLDTLLEQGKAAVASHLAPGLQQIDQTVRAQPLMAGLAGVALLSLLYGRMAKAEGPPHVTRDPTAGTRFEAITRWEDEGGPCFDCPPEPDREWLDEAQGLRARAAEMLAKLDEAARRGLASAADLARHRADIQKALLTDTRATLSKGLETLSDTARQQAYAAREAAYMARLKLARTGRATVEDSPLAAGLGMAALGAAVALMFRPTEAEDRLMGATRDLVVDQARHRARGEAEKAGDLARNLAQAVMQDMDRTRDALHRAAQPPRPVVTPVRH